MAFNNRAKRHADHILREMEYPKANGWVVMGQSFRLDWNRRIARPEQSEAWFARGDDYRYYVTGRLDDLSKWYLAINYRCNATRIAEIDLDLTYSPEENLQLHTIKAL